MYTINPTNSNGQTAESIYLPIFGSTLVNDANHIENAYGALLLRKEYAVQENNDERILYYNNMIKCVNTTIALIRKKLNKQFGTFEFKSNEFKVYEYRRNLFFEVKDMPTDASLFVSIRERTTYEKERSEQKALEAGLNPVDFGNDVITWFIGVNRANDMIAVSDDALMAWFD